VDQAETRYGAYNMAVYELCAQYDAIYDLLEKDMQQIKAELAESFQV